MTEAPDTIILVYDGDGGLRALLTDTVKTALGRQECDLCAIAWTITGKRRAWADAEARLGVFVEELHRDELPPAWRLTRADVPCILSRSFGNAPRMLLTRAEIAACGRSPAALEVRVRDALARRREGTEAARDG